MTSHSGSFDPIVSVEWLRDHLADPAVIIIDVRQYRAWQASHIPGAHPFDVTSVHLARSEPDAIAEWTLHLQAALRTLGITRDSRVVFYEEISGTSAAYGVWLLDAAGLGNGALLDGGIHAWARAGGDLTAEATRPTPSEIEITLDPTVVATAESIREAIDQDEPSLQVLDTRSRREHQLGTIPGAVHVDWMQTLDAQGMLRPAEDNRALYASAGLGDGTPAVAFCGSGFRAAHTYVVLRSLGYPKPQNYGPSWSEWSQRGDLPIE